MALEAPGPCPGERPEGGFRRQLGGGLAPRSRQRATGADPASPDPTLCPKVYLTASSSQPRGQVVTHCPGSASAGTESPEGHRPLEEPSEPAVTGRKVLNGHPYPAPQHPALSLLRAAAPARSCRTVGDISPLVRKTANPFLRWDIPSHALGAHVLDPVLSS